MGIRFPPCLTVFLFGLQRHQLSSMNELTIGWNKSDNMGFDGMWLNGLRADFPDDCYAGQYYNGSWSPINSTEMSAICREGQGTAGTAFYCQSARFDFSGNQPSGWRNIAWTTQQYYQLLRFGVRMVTLKHYLVLAHTLLVQALLIQ